MACWTSAVRFSVTCSSLVLPRWHTQGSEASTLQVDHRSSSWPMLLLLVRSGWQGPESHQSTHVVDIEALVLKITFALDIKSSKCCPNLARLGLILTVVTDCQDCEKSTWFFFHAVLFLEVLYLLQPPNSSCFWSQNKEVFSAKDLMLCHGQTQSVMLPKNFLLLVALRSISRGHHNDLGILSFQLVPKTLQWLWCKILSFLCSQVHWCCNQKSLSIKNGGQIRIV